MTESSNFEAKNCQKLLAQTIDDFTKQSGETPTMLLKFGEDELSEGVLCHDSLIKSKAPHLFLSLKTNVYEGNIGTDEQAWKT